MHLPLRKILQDVFNLFTQLKTGDDPLGDIKFQLKAFVAKNPTEKMDASIELQFHTLMSIFLREECSDDDCKRLYELNEEVYQSSQDTQQSSQDTQQSSHDTKKKKKPNKKGKKETTREKEAREKEAREKEAREKEAREEEAREKSNTILFNTILCLKSSMVLSQQVAEDSSSLFYFKRAQAAAIKAKLPDDIIASIENDVISRMSPECAKKARACVKGHLEKTSSLPIVVSQVMCNGWGLKTDAPSIFRSGSEEHENDENRETVVEYDLKRLTEELRNNKLKDLSRDRLEDGKDGNFETCFFVNDGSRPINAPVSPASIMWPGDLHDVKTIVSSMPFSLHPNLPLSWYDAGAFLLQVIHHRPLIIDH
tara:strand:- start:82 stop:1185 length:1104 start_codon:yes stop_codon:yes gene_type:complete